MRLTMSLSLSEAFFLMSGLYTSLENAEAATKSCESAVLIEAAKILQRKIPAIKAGNNPLRDSINTCSRSASERELFKYAFPMVPTMRATAMAIITQNIAILLDNFTSSLDRIAINLTRMWGIPKYPSPQPMEEIISFAEILCPSGATKGLTNSSPNAATLWNASFTPPRAAIPKIAVKTRATNIMEP